MTSDAPSQRSERGGALTPLRHRDFALLFSGQLTSALGDQAFALALPWTVIAVTGDPVQVAVVLAAEAIPRVLTLPLGGALADRINPRVVMLVSDIGRAGVVGALGMTLFWGLLPLWVVALLAALQGVGSGLFLPGSQAILPWTVRSAEIPAANGLMQIILWVTMVVGPVLGGVAAAAQAATAFLADAASFVVSAITLALIRLSPPDTPAAQTPTSVDGQAAYPPARLLTTSPRLAQIQAVENEVAEDGGAAERVASPPAHGDATLQETEVAEDRAVAAPVDASVDAPADRALPASLHASLGVTASHVTAEAPGARGGQITTTPPPAATVSAAATAPARSSVLGEIGAGMAFTFGQPLMRTTVLVSILGNLAFTGTFGIALIVLSRNLDPRPVTLGLLLGACGVGGVLGSLAAGPTGRARRRGLWVLLLWALMPVALALVPIYAGAAASLPFPVDLGAAHIGALKLGDQVAHLTASERLVALAILLGLVSFIIALGETVFISIIQQRTPPAYMARVFSVQFMAAGVTQPLSFIATGFILAAYGNGVAFLVTAALFFLAAVIGLSSPAMRRA